MGSPCDHAVRDISSKLSIFLSLRAIYFRSYRYETPCKLPYTKSRTLVSDDSDDDLFASTPQKSPPKKTWRQKRVSVPTEESETGREGPETEIDSTPSSYLQIPSNERDEMVLVCSGKDL